MRYIKYAFLAVIAVAFVTMALANRDMITLAILPDPLVALTGFDFSVTLPLFVIVGVSVLVGLLLGFVWEWLRERSYRAQASSARREAEALRAELGRARKIAPEAHRDEVLALVEAGEPAR